MLTNKQSVYRLLDGTSTVYLSTHTCKYSQSYRHSQDTNKHTFKHHQVLSSVRQDMLQMGMFRIVVAECNYKETERQLKEQFICIHGLNDNEMLTEIIHELTTIKDMSVVTSE